VAAARDFALAGDSPDSLDADCKSSYLASVSATLMASMGPGNVLDAEGVGAAVVLAPGLSRLSCLHGASTTAAITEHGV
jgi:hypothetical protein